MAEGVVRRLKEEVEKSLKRLGRSEVALEKARVDAEVRLMNNTSTQGLIME